MSVVSDPIDAKLIGLLQTAVPVRERPFAELGAACGLTEEDVLNRIRRLKAARVIRQISAIFDTRSLGYASSLVAAKIDPARVDKAAAVINLHPGVSHNYLRNHTYNLWYTIAVPPTSRLGLEKTVDILHAESGAAATRLLPTLKLYKIGVQFDVTGESRPDDRTPPSYTENQRATDAALTPKEIEFVRLTQRDLPLTTAPFLDYANALGLPFTELQILHEHFLQTGRMRRFAAVLHHRQAGFRANAMGAWAVPPDDPAELDRIGERMAGFRAVSHCYQRPSYPDWPYNIFTMVHGKNPAECEQTLAAISMATGLRDYRALYSSKEYKKIRVRYFTDEEARWEAAHAS